MDDETHETVPRRWKERFVTAGVQAPDVRFTAQTLPGISMSARLPKQNNHTDCGLFLLSYMDFFAAANPRCIVSEGNNAQDVHALDPCSKAADTGTLLQKGWFHRCNAARLRDHLRALICRLMLDCVSQEDQRRNTLVCVVNDYDNKPHKVGFRYLDPTSYLDHVRDWPDEDDPITQEGVLSSGSDAEVGDPKKVLQSPSPLTTRAAAKKAGTRPDEALPMDTRACRKRDKAPQPTVDCVGSASEVNKCAVGLSSPDKVVDTSQVDVAASPAAQGSTEDEGEEEMPGQQWEWRRATGQQDTHGTCFTRQEATANDVSGSPVTPPSQQDPETLPVRRPPLGAEQSSDPHVSEPAVAGTAVGLSAGHEHIPRPSAGKRSWKAKAAGAPGAKASSLSAADVTERAAKPGKAAAAAHENLQGQFQKGKFAGVGCDVTPDQAAERSGDRRGDVAGQCRPSPHGIQVARQLVPPPSDGQIPGGHRDPPWVCKGRMQQHVHDSPSSSDDQCMSTPQLDDSARAQSRQPVSKGLSNGHGAQAHVAFRKHTRFPDGDAEPTTELVPFADKAGESPSHHNGAEQHTYPEYEEYSTGSSYGSGSRPKRRRCNSVSAWLAHKVYMDKPFTEKAPAAVAAGSDARAEVDIAAVGTVLLRRPQVAMSVAADVTQEDGQPPYGLGNATSRSVSGEPQGLPEPHTGPESLTAKSKPSILTSRFLAMLDSVGYVARIGAGGKRSAAVSSTPAGTAVRAGKHVAALPNFPNAMKERDKHMDVEIRFNKERLWPQNDSPASMQAKQQPILQGVQPVGLGSPVDGGQGPRLKAAGSRYRQSGHGHDHHRRQSTQAPSAAEMQQSSPKLQWPGPRASPQPSSHSGHAGPASLAQGGGYRHLARHPSLLHTSTAVPDGKGDAPRRPATELNTGGSASQFQGILGDREVRRSDGGLLSSAVGDGDPQGVGHCKQHRAGQGSPEQHPMQDSSRSQRCASWQLQPRAVGSALDAATAPALAASSGPVGDQPSLPQSPSLRLELQDGGGSQDQAGQRRVSEEGLVITDDETVPRSSGGGGTAGFTTEQAPVSRAPCCAPQANDTTSTERSAAASPDLLTPASACNRDIMALPDMFWKASIEGHIVGKYWLEIGASRQVPATEGMPNGTATATMALAAVDPSGAGGVRNEPFANAGDVQLDGRQLSDSGTVGGFQRMVSPLTAGTATRSQDGGLAAGVEYRSSSLRDCKGASCLRQQELASCKARQSGIPMGEGPSHAEAAIAVEKAPGSAARAVGNAAAAAPDREQDNAEPWMAAHGRAVAIPAAVSTGNVLGNGGESEIVIINDDESDDQLAEGTHEVERGGDGSTAAPLPQAQEIGTSRFGRGTENDAEELDDSADEDSLDTGWPRDADGRDESDEDSGEAFVKGRGPGTGQPRNATAMTPSARGKQAKQANKQKERGSHGSIRKGPVRGRGRNGGHNGGKPCSSTKGVTPSRGGNAGGSTCGRDGKQGRLRNLRRDAPAGGIDAYCMRQGSEMVRTKVKPEFPRSGQSFEVGTTRTQHDRYDLTLEES
ncbi:hypothetical protein Vretifemale_13999 [Volvox reticuliferus]|uniref:Ubiquitin-like protease family profile domain-containing protein n=1 Tax=Volvox reticuliferus TaxID=1737510 RepID=A0A8J4CLE2_9CHLO|nr:hypothetical protein Vretifemale_13999 [Volvox reticuliferus]